MRHVKYLVAFVLVLTIVNTLWFMGDQLYAGVYKPSLGGGCDFCFCYDVNNCGTAYPWNGCNPDSKCSPSRAPITGSAQCLLCQIWQVQVWAHENVVKFWYDCTRDNHPDCEYQNWTFTPKGITTCPSPGDVGPNPDL